MPVFDKVRSRHLAAMQSMRGDRLRNSLNQIFDSDRIGKRRADRFVTLVRDQYFTAGRFTLQPRGDVDAVADHRVVVAICRSHVGRERRSRGDTDAHPENDPTLQLGIHLVYGFLYSACRTDGAKHVILVLDGDVEQRHHRVAEKMVDDPVMLSDDPRARLEKFFRDGRQFFDPQFMGEASEATTVGEEHCDFGETARLPVRLSPVAEIRIRHAAPYTPQPPVPARGAGEWNTIR
jgi:hypothetical protein